MRALSIWPAILLASRAAGQVIGFNRTAGEVEVGTCEGLKKNAELGVDISIVVTANLRCAETITVPAGVHVSIGSAEDENYLVAIAESFAAPDPASVTLLVNPEESHLSLDRLTFANEAGTAGSPGAARAVWNRGSLEVNGCSFEGLNYASLQDGGAVSAVRGLSLLSEGRWGVCRHQPHISFLSRSRGRSVVVESPASLLGRHMHNGGANRSRRNVSPR